MSALGNRILRVDHAGEHGAVSIYTGQIVAAHVTARSMLTELGEFREHERAHRAIFAAELARRGVRRCRSYGLCAFGGFVLGFLTGVCGRSAIAATTVAVERVVLGHLDEQLALLRDEDPEAVAAIASIVRDEREHHNRSAAQVEVGTFWPRIVTPIVSGSTEAVIRLGMWL